ncbi:Beta-ketoacyl synthase [Actinobacteria bacterium OK074]|nr:Beta-ketoacyl synthase [Actinobacteria bacterium OK074]
MGRNGRVLVTGVGAMTPLGADAPSSWSGLLDGKSGVRFLEEEWAADLPVRAGHGHAGRSHTVPSGGSVRRMLAGWPCQGWGSGFRGSGFRTPLPP